MKTVMIVDDSSSLRQLVALTLGGAGYQVIEAADAHDALRQLATARVHLVLCDVNMPGMDGIGFLKALRLTERGRYLPVIMLTSVREPSWQAAGRLAGARAWIVKPFSAPMLVDAVTRMVAA